MLAMNIENITFNGAPLSTDEQFALGYYLQNLHSEGRLQTPIGKPHTLDIALVENHIRLTLQNEAGEQRVDMPIRDWRYIIPERTEIVEKSHLLENEGTEQEIDAHDRFRRQRHNAAAEKLQDFCEAEGVTMDFETARNLFACVAQLAAPTLQRVATRDGGRDR